MRGGAGRHFGPEAGLCRDLAAARGRAGRRLRAVASCFLAATHRNPARMGACGSRRRPLAALGAGGVRHRHRVLFCRRSRAGFVGGRYRGHRAMRGRGAAAAAKILSHRRHDRSRRGGLCDRDLEDGADCAWRAGAADVFGVADRLCRNARHSRAHRPICAARRHHGKRARDDQARTRAAVGEEGHGARGRQFCRAEGAAVAAALAGAAGQLRFQPRHVLRRHRRLRLRDGRDQDRGAISHRRRAAPALFRVHAGPARHDRRADQDHAGRRQARDCHRAVDRAARRDLAAGERRDVHLRSRPCAFDLRLSHGRRRRRRVLRGAGAAGAVSRAHGRLRHQEMVGGRPRSSPPRSICCCRGQKWRRSARSS